MLRKIKPSEREGHSRPDGSRAAAKALRAGALLAMAIKEYVRMGRSSLLVTLMISLAGCTHLQLKRSVLHQSGTITDIRYSQVMHNLAMQAANPSLLPYYSKINDGTAEVTDGIGPKSALTLGWKGGSSSELLELDASRGIRENWTLDPLHDPERLEAMRCAYHYVLGVHSGEPCDDCAEKLHHFKLDQELAKIPPGWLHVGHKADVPKDACFVNGYCETYAWVMPDGIEGLTRLSLIILDIATVDLASLAPPNKKQVRTYDGQCRLIQVEVTEDIDASDPDCSKDKRTGEMLMPAPAPLRKQRLPSFSLPPRSLFR